MENFIFCAVIYSKEINTTANITTTTATTNHNKVNAN